MDTRRLTDESEIDWTLQQLSTHRETHVHWRDHFRKGPCTDCSPDVIKNVGDLAEQEASVGHYDRMIAAVKSLRADAAELARLQSLDSPLPLRDVLVRLADAAEHLLDGHNCDKHGWEEVRDSAKKAREIVAILNGGQQ